MRALHNHRRNKSEGEDGFTLIELLLVIIILGILAAVVVFSVRGVSDRGQSSACKTSRQTTLAALESFYAKNGVYPATLAALKTDGFVADLPNLAADSLSVNGPQKGNTTPPVYEWTIAYLPTGTPSGSTYTLTPTGPSGGSC
jgi:prepilin-type N-terminal cleavage/methylation domain-containing protein